MWEDEDNERPPGSWLKKHGNCRVPSQQQKTQWARDRQHPHVAKERERKARQVESQVQRDQESVAQGIHPKTGNWTPFWKGPTGRGWNASKRTRFTSETGRQAGLKRSPRKAEAVRLNGQRGARYGYLGKAHGIKGGRPKRIAA